MTGLHKSITLSFLVVGHTKFAPDWCFGLLKKQMRMTKVGTLTNIAKVVKESATVNVPQLCGAEVGSVLVSTHIRLENSFQQSSEPYPASRPTTTSTLLTLYQGLYS